ncbi:MAG: hypothetical protein DHS20C09_21600 [marine bacterium B5-7]|nr:MAG: hypothetical protein DHS20C09_21600 [marine bacterium B5-7]
MNIRFLICVAGCIVAIIIIGLSTKLLAQQAVFNDPVEPEMSAKLNLGKMNYEAYCASCHGKTARGSDKGPTFISRIYHPGHHGDGAFYIAPKKGARAHHFKFGDMPPVKGVNDSQLQTIIEYVRAVQQANGLF